MTDLAISETFDTASDDTAPAPLIPDGVFFNMDDATYHASTALGSSDLKALLINPVAWFAKNRSDQRELYYPTTEAESIGKRFGRALHKIALEGQEAFERCYFVAPTAPDGLLERNEELHAFVSERAAATGGIAPWFTGLPELITESIVMKKGGIKKTARKEHLIAAARHLGCDALFCDWEAGVLAEANGRELISAEWWTKLHLMRRVIDAHSRAGQVISNGRAELSVFWTDEATGVQYKVRFDYLRTRIVCDLKSYAPRDGREPIDAFVSAVETFAYDISRAHYMDARVNALPALVEAGAIYDCGTGGIAPANAADMAFIRKVAAETDPTWFWLACSTIGFPEADVIELPQNLLVTAAAATQLDEAKAKFVSFRDRFGDDGSTPWIADRGIVVLDDASFSMRQANRGAIRWTTRDD